VIAEHVHQPGFDSTVRQRCQDVQHARLGRGGRPRAGNSLAALYVHAGRVH
jgi:hypothetical protein